MKRRENAATGEAATPRDGKHATPLLLVMLLALLSSTAKESEGKGKMQRKGYCSQMSGQYYPVLLMKVSKQHTRV